MYKTLFRLHSFQDFLYLLIFEVLLILWKLSPFLVLPFYWRLRNRILQFSTIKKIFGFCVKIFHFWRKWGSLSTDSTFGISCRNKLLIQVWTWFMSFTGIIIGNMLKNIAFVGISKLNFTIVAGYFFLLKQITPIIRLFRSWSWQEALLKGFNVRWEKC